MASDLEPRVQNETSGASALSASTLTPERPAIAEADVCGTIVSGRPARDNAEETPQAEGVPEGPANAEVAEEAIMEGEVEDAVLGSSKTAVEEETSEETKAGEEVDDEAIKARAEATPPCVGIFSLLNLVFLFASVGSTSSAST